MYKIRHTTEEDIPRCMELYDAARGIMRASGNMNQWTNGYPSVEVLKEDIRLGNSYVVVDEGVCVGIFACIMGEDPTYRVIEGGEWRCPEVRYATIHRLGSTPESHGVARCVFDYARGLAPSLRADTHKDNRIMQRILEGYGFRYCGIIYLKNGDKRRAYQYLMRQY